MTKAALAFTSLFQHGPWNSDSIRWHLHSATAPSARTHPHAFSRMLIPRDLQSSPSLPSGDSPHCQACLTSHNSVMGHMSIDIHVSIDFIDEIIFFGPIQRRLFAPLISPLTECLMGYNTKFPFFCCPLARVYSQMIFIAVVTTHQMATWFHHSNGTKERDLSSTVFSISRLVFSLPRGLLMRASRSVKTEAMKKERCLFVSPPAFQNICIYFLVEHRWLFILVQACVAVLKRRADGGLVAQEGIFVVCLLLIDENKPAPIPLTPCWHLWEIFLLQHASCFLLFWACANKFCNSCCSIHKHIFILTHSDGSSNTK